MGETFVGLGCIVLLLGLIGMVWTWHLPRPDNTPGLHRPSHDPYDSDHDHHY